MTPTEQDLGIFLRGDTVPEINFQVFDESGAPIDITGQTISSQLRFGAKAGQLRLDIDLASGITIVDAAQGQFKFDAFQLEFWTVGTYFYDIQFDDAGTITTRFTGKLIIDQDVTE